jgi:glycosyltransferase involved in cell wall biosynthesis
VQPSQGGRSNAGLLGLPAAFPHSLVAPDGDSEGSPVSVMEAQLCGLPVVTTHHAGITEVVREGETGLLVDEGDVAGTAARPSPWPTT